MKVFVRTRPTATFAQELVEILADEKTLNIHQSKGRRCGGVNHSPSSWCFQLDGVLHLLSQEKVYARVGQDVVLGALDGYNDFCKGAFSRRFCPKRLTISTFVGFDVWTVEGWGSRDRELEKTFEVVKHKTRGREEGGGATQQQLQLDNQYAILGDK